MNFSYSRLSAFPVIVLVLSFVTSVPVAWAQQGEGISIETFKPSTSVNSIFELTLPRPKDHLEWSIGGLVSYAHNPMKRETRVGGEVVDTDYPVEYRVTADLYAALGVFGVGEIGIAIPVIAYQTGEGGVPGSEAQPAGIGDPRLELKARLFEVGILDVGLQAIITAPLGHYASAGTDIMGSTGPTGEPKLLADLKLGPFIAAFNGGFLLRSPVTIGDIEQTHSLTWNAALAVDWGDYYEPGGMRIAVETNGEASINFETLAETPMEVLFGLKYRTSNDLIIALGGGPGLSSAVGTPAFRVFAGITFDKVLRNCPAGPEDMDGFEDDDKCIDPDNDLDGLLDEEDKCPNKAEDKDGYKDEDGCPDNDNDGDGIPDGVDRCMMIPEDTDDFEDEDGCPEEGPGRPTVKITDTQLLISSKIYFDFDKATIKEVSHPILDAVAEALRNNPHIIKVRIEGHTDNEGTTEYNLKLSQDRAKAVADYIISKNINEERLIYEGYGFSRPKASNTSDEGKAINRRVEFTIMEKE